MGERWQCPYDFYLPTNTFMVWLKTASRSIGLCDVILKIFCGFLEDYMSCDKSA